MSSARVHRLALAALLSCAGRPLAQDVPDRQAARVTRTVELVQRTGPAVVNLCQCPLDDPEPGAPGFGLRESESLGSGLHIDPDGYILTDAHALPRETGPIRVRLGDGRSVPATLVSFDRDNGLALLKIASRPGAPYAVARLGTSRDLMVGEPVIAIGNPHGGASVTSGIVSAVGRMLPAPAAGGPAQDFFQIDVSTDPVHSGGPVLNIDGEVIGILHVGAGADPRGLAIPVDRVRRSLTTRLLDPRLFGELVSGVEPAPGPDGHDVVVGTIVPGGPAERAGLLAGDRLLEIGGTPVAWEFDVNKALLSAGADATIPVLVQRGDERLELGLHPERGQSPLLLVWRRLGVQIVDHNRYKGVRVARVDPLGAAWRLGLRAGDLIDGLDERLLDSSDDLFDSVRDLPHGTRVVIHVWRGGQAWAGPVDLR